MRKYFLIGAGGFLGAVLRYIIKSVQITGLHCIFPLNTMIINIAGSFVLAFILTIAFGRRFDTVIRLGIGTGFIGAFTTFSTMCKEAAGLISSGNYRSAIVYVLVSAGLGLTAAFFGAFLARKVDPGLLESEEDDEIYPESDVE